MAGDCHAPRKIFMLQVPDVGLAMTLLCGCVTLTGLAMTLMKDFAFFPIALKHHSLSLLHQFLQLFVPLRPIPQIGCAIDMSKRTHNNQFTSPIFCKASGSFQ